MNSLNNIPYDKVFPLIGLRSSTEVVLINAEKEDEEVIYQTHHALYTTIRLLHEGKYYKMNVGEVFVVTNETYNLQPPHYFYQKFLIGVYNYQLFGKVSPGLIMTNGREIFALDTNQDSEPERIRKYLII